MLPTEALQNLTTRPPSRLTWPPLTRPTRLRRRVRARVLSFTSIPTPLSPSPSSLSSSNCSANNNAAFHNFPPTPFDSFVSKIDTSTRPSLWRTSSRSSSSSGTSPKRRRFFLTKLRRLPGVFFLLLLALSRANFLQSFSHSPFRLRDFRFLSVRLVFSL